MFIYGSPALLLLSHQVVHQPQGNNLMTISINALTFFPKETDVIAEPIDKTDKDGKFIVAYEFYE